MGQRGYGPVSGRRWMCARPERERGDGGNLAGNGGWSDYNRFDGLSQRLEVPVGTHAGPFPRISPSLVIPVVSHSSFSSTPLAYLSLSYSRLFSLSLHLSTVHIDNHPETKEANL